MIDFSSIPLSAFPPSERAFERAKRAANAIWKLSNAELIAQARGFYPELSDNVNFLDPNKYSRHFMRARVTEWAKELGIPMKLRLLTLARGPADNERTEYAYEFESNADLVAFKLRWL